MIEFPITLGTACVLGIAYAGLSIAVGRQRGQANVSLGGPAVSVAIGEEYKAPPLLVASVNGNRKHFETGIKDLAHGESQFPGVTEKILTHPLNGLDRFEDMMHLLVHEKNALKVFVNVAE